MAQAAAYSAVCAGALIVPVLAYLPRPGGWLGPLAIMGALVFGGVACGILVLLFHRVFSNMLSGALSQAMGLTGGGATRSHFAMSQVEGLIVRHQWDDAVAQLHSAMYAHTGETGAEIAQTLANLLSFRLQQHSEAATVYRRARREWGKVAGTRGQEGVAHCTRRLLDLYEGPLANEAAAAAERRRLGA